MTRILDIRTQRLRDAILSLRHRRELAERRLRERLSK